MQNRIKQQYVFLVRRVFAFANSPPWYISTSYPTVSNCTPRSLTLVACAPSLKLSPWVISWPQVWLCVVNVMVSWNPASRVAKLLGQRAKCLKFVNGLMIHSGDPRNDYFENATRHVLLRQSVLGIKIKIMLSYVSKNKIGSKKPLPDNIAIVAKAI